MHRFIAFLLALLVLSACSSGNTSGGGAAGQPDGGEQQSQDAAEGEGDGSGEGTASVQVEITSGAGAGSYTGEGDKLDCNIGADGSGATFSDYESTNGVAMFTFIGSDDQAEPADFNVTIEISGDEPYGETFQSAHSLSVNTGMFDTEPEGSGTARRTDNNDQMTWDIEGTSADGTEFTASITCGPVDRR